MHRCEPFINEFGHCKECDESRSELLKTLERNCLRDIQENIDRHILQNLADASEAYLKARLRETSFASRILPIETVPRVRVTRDLQLRGAICSFCNGQGVSGYNWSLHLPAQPCSACEGVGRLSEEGPVMRVEW